MAYAHATLAFLHTSPVHVATFDELVAAADPGIVLAHTVAPSLLTRAQDRGIDAVRDEVADELQRLSDGGARVIVCTCSSLGEVAENAPTRGAEVLRVDRPMAELATAAGGRVAVVTAVDSTVTPTMRLLRACAADAGTEPEFLLRTCHRAWGAFLDGDERSYLRLVADHVRTIMERERPSTVVLAQASMAPVADHLAHAGPAILASPRLAVDAALERLAAL